MPDIRHCVVCAATIAPMTRSHARTCSSRCRSRLYAQRHADEIAAERASLRLLAAAMRSGDPENLRKAAKAAL